VLSTSVVGIAYLSSPNTFPAECAGARAAVRGALGHTAPGRGYAWGGGGSGGRGSAGTNVERPETRINDSGADAEVARPSATTAVVGVAQSAELAHGVAWLVASTTGPEGWDAICWSQLAGVARWTWPHRSGKPTGNIWPVSTSVATSLTRESFIRWGIYHDAVMVVMTTHLAKAVSDSSVRIDDRQLAHLRHATRYKGTETGLSSSPFASVLGVVK